MGQVISNAATLPVANNMPMANGIISSFLSILLQQWPIKTNVRATDIIDRLDVSIRPSLKGNTWEVDSLFCRRIRDTVLWLEEENYVRVKVSTDGSEYEDCVLTEKCLRLLGQIPSNLADDKTVGEKIIESNKPSATLTQKLQAAVDIGHLLYGAGTKLLS
jgi:hypothetical protein